MRTEPVAPAPRRVARLTGETVVVVEDASGSSSNGDLKGSIAYETLTGEKRTLRIISGDSGRGDGVNRNWAITDHLTDWRTLVREELAPSSAPVREQIISHFAESLNDSPAGSDVLAGLAKVLYNTREALRERLPIAAVSTRSPQGISIDALIALNERSFYVRGWFRDEESSVIRLTAVSPEGGRTEILPICTRVDRTDVSSFYGSMDSEEPEGQKPGFICAFELPAPSVYPTGWVFEMESKSGQAFEVHAPDPLRGLSKGRSSILSDLSFEKPTRQELISGQIHPALSKLQERWHASVRLRTVEQYGKPIAAAQTSVIIPLYQRIDFLEHQLAQFVHDRELCETADLIYVLDSPEQTEELAAKAARLALLYRVPFRIATLNRNGGYSAANNLGASLARAGRLLLLNSDVLPARPGWLRALNQFYSATPHIGALGPKLLFEDDSLQHAGLYFSPMLDGSGWENQHFFKGFHRDLPAANVARRVPAVTGACLLVDRSMFEKVGGLRGCYIQGDYEDSDFCLRLAGLRRENWYLPGVELYHLEGQSYPATIRTLTSRYNRWLHTHLWSSEIEKAVNELQAP